MRMHESLLIRVRSRDGFRYGPALGIRSLAVPHASLSRRRGYRALDPRPRTSPRFAILTRNADVRFSGSGYRPPTSATSLPTHGHALEHPILASSTSRAVSQVTSKLHSLSPIFLGTGDLPLSKKDHECCEPRQSF